MHRSAVEFLREKFAGTRDPQERNPQRVRAAKGFVSALVTAYGLELLPKWSSRHASDGNLVDQVSKVLRLLPDRFI